MFFDSMKLHSYYLHWYDDKVLVFIFKLYTIIYKFRCWYVSNDDDEIFTIFLFIELKLDWTKSLNLRLFQAFKTE